MRRAWILAALVAACGGPAGRTSTTPPTPVVTAAAATAPRAWAETEGERAIAARYRLVAEKCSIGNVAACRRLSQRLHFVSNDREYVAYAPALAEACRTRGLAVACGAHGAMLVGGLGVAVDAERGLALLRQACSERDDIACAQLGEIYLRGEHGQAGKADEGNLLIRQTCTQLGGWPCTTAAQLDARAGNDALLRPGLEHACDTGDAYACYQAGLAYAAGEATFPHDEEKASERYQRACDADLADACYNLAWQYRRGTGVQQDDARATQLADLACTLGDATACDDLAGEEGARDPAAYQRYCDRWGASACFLAAEQIGKTRGEVAEVAALVIADGVRSCLRGHMPACHAMEHLGKDFVRACDSADPGKQRDACAYVGFLHRFGVAGLNADPARSRAAFAKACKVGAKVACAEAR